MGGGGEPAKEGGEGTLNPTGRAIPQGGIRAHRHYADIVAGEHNMFPRIAVHG